MQINPLPCKAVTLYYLGHLRPLKMRGGGLVNFKALPLQSQKLMYQSAPYQALCISPDVYRCSSSENSVTNNIV